MRVNNGIDTSVTTADRAKAMLGLTTEDDPESKLPTAHQQKMEMLDSIIK